MSGLVADPFLAAQRLLVISPHADDDVFGCAGTMARMKGLGAEVFVMIMTVGDLDHYDGRDGSTAATTRAEEFSRAADLLKVSDTEILFTDAQTHLRLDSIPRRDLIRLIERDAKLSLDRLRPSMVVLPAPSYNQDHVATFQAGFTACRPHEPSLKNSPQIVATYDSPTLFWNPRNESFRPNLYVDISEYLDAKWRAMECHASQRRPPPHHCSFENVERLARLRGHEVSVEAAEAYDVLRLTL